MAGAWRAEHDFYIDRDTLFIENQLFEDNEFPCPISDEGSPCMWVRPPTLINTPVFIRDVATRAVLKGQMSCDFFPVILDILQQRPHLWSYIVADDQSFEEDYAGMFLFRFWRSGKMEPVIVDDFLPFNVDTKTFMLSTLAEAPDLWCALLEKAYAKFLGGYELLKTVRLSVAISDILGCSLPMYNIASMGVKMFKVLKGVFDFDNIAIAKVNISPVAADVFRPELIHSLYTVTSFTPEKDDDEKKQWVLSIRQPMTLDGSSNASLDNTLTFKEFMDIFDDLYVGIPRFSNLFSKPAVALKSWQTLTISGKWSRSRTTDAEFLAYPFNRINVSKPDSYGEKGLCTMVLSLMQCCYEPSNDLLEIGLVIYGLRGEEKLQKKIDTQKLALSQPVIKTDIYPTKEITMYLCLEPGQYLIVPETKKACMSIARSRYLLTLYTIEPVILMNGGIPTYGEGFTCPVGVTISACDYVVLGKPIRVAAKLTGIPSRTRYTMSMVLMFRRTSQGESHESTIKARMDFVEVCQGLMDKELVLWVYYHEYFKYPLQGEEFVARCSVFIHELSTEITARKTVTTMLPKITVAADKYMKTGKPAMLTALLLNTLPISIRPARFRILCTQSNYKVWVTGSTYELPPFATIWIICQIKAEEPVCHYIKVYFLSEQFKRSVSLDVQAQDSEGLITEACPTDEYPVTGRKNLNDSHEDVHIVSCCVNHSQVPLDLHCFSIKGPWYSMDTNDDCKPAPNADEAPDQMLYCLSSRMRDDTPVSELPQDEVENEEGQI